MEQGMRAVKKLSRTYRKINEHGTGHESGEKS